MSTKCRKKVSSNGASCNKADRKSKIGNSSNTLNMYDIATTYSEYSVSEETSGDESSDGKCEKANVKSINFESSNEMEWYIIEVSETSSDSTDEPSSEEDFATSSKCRELFKR